MATETLLSRSNSRGSDWELAYASPRVISQARVDEESVKRHQQKQQTRKRATSDEDGKLEADGRKRRQRGSSDDEGYLEYDGLINEDLRVGGPTLSAIPLINQDVPKDHPIYERLQASKRFIIGEMAKIINKYAIRIQGMGFWQRRSAYVPEDPPVITALIIATRETVDNTWLKASREIRALLQDQNFSEISVEIADPSAFVPETVSPVLQTDEIFEKWDDVRCNIVQEIDLKDVKTIGCWRLGKSPDSHQNAPTVLVTVALKSTRTWKRTREIIITILTRFALSMVAVKIVKAEVVRSSSFNCDVVRGPALLGQSLSPHGNKIASGTLGGFVQLKYPKSNHWDTFGLTCFHCVLPRDSNLPADLGSSEEKWRENGISLFDPEAAEHLKVDHPSLKDMSDHLEYLNKEVKEIEEHGEWGHLCTMVSGGLYDQLSRLDQARYKHHSQSLQKYRKCIADINAFQGKGGELLGSVVAGSGMRTRSVTTAGHTTSHLTSVDWALVGLREDRVGTNEVPGEGFGIRDLVSGQEGVRHDDELRIHGRSSGLSRGKYNKLWTSHINIKVVEGKNISIETLEHSIVHSQAGQSFSREGDSGAFVHTFSERFVGLLFGGSPSLNISYFTHVKDLFADIRDLTGAEEVRLPPED